MDITRAASQGKKWRAICGRCGQVSLASEARATAERHGLRIGLPPMCRFQPAGKGAAEADDAEVLAELLELPDQAQVDRVAVIVELHRERRASSAVTTLAAGPAVGLRGGR